MAEVSVALAPAASSHELVPVAFEDVREFFGTLTWRATIPIVEGFPLVRVAGVLRPFWTGWPGELGADLAALWYLEREDVPKAFGDGTFISSMEKVAEGVLRLMQEGEEPDSEDDGKIEHELSDLVRGQSLRLTVEVRDLSRNAFSPREASQATLDGVEKAPAEGAEKARVESPDDLRVDASGLTLSFRRPFTNIKPATRHTS
jgi:hypothetical protein